MAAAAHMRRLRQTMEGPTSLGTLAARLGHDGIGLLTIILATPFLVPLPLAGLGTPVGLLMIAAGLQLALDRKTLALPRFVADRRLEARTVEKALAVTEKILNRLERFARPRWAFLAHQTGLLATAIVVLGIGFAIPFYVPLGNPVSAIATILLSLGLLEEDGLLVFSGLATACLSAYMHVAFLAFLWHSGRALLH